MSLVFSSSSATPRTSTYPPFPCLLFLSPFPTLQHALLSAALSTESDLSHGDAEFSSLLTCGHIVTMVSRTVAKATRPPPKRWVPGTPHTERKRSRNKTPENVSTLSLIPPPVEPLADIEIPAAEKKGRKLKSHSLSITTLASMPDHSPRIEPYVRKPGSPERRQGDPHDKRGHSKGRALSPKVSPLSSIPALFESSLTLRLKLTEEGSSNISFLFLTPIPTSMPDLSTQLEPHPSLSISRAHVFSHDAKCHAPHH